MPLEYSAPLGSPSRCGSDARRSESRLCRLSVIGQTNRYTYGCDLENNLVLRLGLYKVAKVSGICAVELFPEKT